MVLLEAIFIFLILFLMEQSRTAKYKKRIEEYNKTGWNVKSNRDLENSLFLKYCYDYEHVNDDLVPEKYRGFFAFNSRAMCDYFMDLAARDVWKQGYRPYLFGMMPKEGFDFLEGFHKKYDQQVDEFNKRHEAMRNRTYFD